MFNNTKADGNMFWILILAFLALVVGAIILLFAKPAIEKGFGVTTTQIGSLDDFDDDKIANFFDKCPCTPPGTVEDSSLQGCPRGTTAEQSQENKKLFKDGKCAEIAPRAGEQETGTTSFELFDGTTKISIGPTYSTSAVSISPQASCATECLVKIILPDGQEQTQDAAEDIDISKPGRYFIIFVEQNQEKIRYQIEKQE